MTTLVNDNASLSRSDEQSGTWLLPLAATILATLLSFIVSGYIPISSNNIYHLPILFGSYDLPQFQNDPFVQSLRNFSSGFWLLFGGSARYVEPKLFLGAWLVISHFLFLSAAIHLARSLGHHDARLLSAFVVVLALASLSIGETAGGGGLMIEGFTHSELANASVLMTFSYALSRRYGLCVLLACVTFFLNAFMAVWSALPVFLLVSYHLASGQVSFARMVRSAIPGLIGLVLVAPVLFSILSNDEGLAATSFSYPEFLWGFYPSHFFLSSITPNVLLEMAGLIAVLLLTIRRRGKASAGFAALALGALGVLVLGIIAPSVTDSRTILNLHLIRSFVLLHWLALFSLLLFALQLCWSTTDRRDMAFGLVMIGLLLLPRPLWMLCIPVLLVEFLERKFLGVGPAQARILRSVTLVFLAVCIAVVPVRAYRKFAFTSERTQATSQWEALGLWARENTEPNSVFLVGSDDAGESTLGFSYTSERQIWTAAKYGAAVMWSPSYMGIWSSRQKAVEALNDVGSMIAYAKAEGIAYVAAVCGGDAAAAYRHGGLCIYDGAVR